MQGDKIKIRVGKTEYFVTGGDFSSLLAAVKALPNRRYIGAQKLWLVEGSPEMVRGQIENSGFRLEGGTPVADDAPPLPATDRDSIKIATATFTATITGAPFSDLLAAIKALPERRFDGESKRWTVSGSMLELKNYFEEKGMQLENIVAETAPPPQPAAPALPNMPAPPAPPDFPADFAPPPDDFPETEDIMPPADILPPPDDLFTPPSDASSPAQKPARRDRIRVIVDNRPLVIVGGTFQEMLAAVKEIPGRRFDGETKQWMLPDDIDSVQQHLNSKGFRLEEV